MAKLFVDTDELYPYPVLNESSGIEIEVPQETLERWRNVLGEFHEVLSEIWEAEEAAKKAGKRYVL